MKSRLLYGLESLEIPKAQMSRLEAFQLKGLRKILKMEITFINRGNTNHEVFRRANWHMRARSGHSARIEAISCLLRKRRISLVGHALKQDKGHLLRNISFQNHTPIPVGVLYRRQGYPRIKWMDSTLKITWDEINPNQERFQPTPAQLQIIQNAAENYLI